MLAIALLLAPAAAQGRVGELDQTFGDGGRVVTPFKPGPVRTAIASDGSVVLYAGGVLIRFLADGRLDPGFGEGGRLIPPKELEGLGFDASAIAIDSQGRVLLFGTASSVTSVAPTGPGGWAAVLRLRVDGTLDPSFGEGKGFIRGDFGLRSKLVTDSPSVGIPANTGRVAGGVDSHDRPVFIASVPETVSGCLARRGSEMVPRAVIRLTEAGSPDPTFGKSGVSPIEGLGESPTLVIDASDQPLAAVIAVRKTGCRLGDRVFRFGADGIPLPGFGANGVRLYPGLKFSAIDLSGAMLFGELFYNQTLLLTKSVTRVRPNGNPDKNFGEEGVAKVRMPAGTDRGLAPVAADAKGGTLLVGSFNLPKPQKRGHGKKKRHPRKHRPTRSFIAIGRLLPTGKLDLGFGKEGWIVTPFERPRNAFVRQAVLDLQGRLLIAVGSGTAPQPPGTRLTLARYFLGG